MATDAVRIDRQAQIQIENLEPAQLYAADQQGAKVERQFRARRRHDGTTVFLDNEIVDGQRRTMIAVADRGGAQRKFVAAACEFVEQFDDARREPGKGDGALRKQQEEAAERQRAQQRCGKPAEHEQAGKSAARRPKKRRSPRRATGPLHRAPRPVDDDIAAARLAPRPVGQLASLSARSQRGRGRLSRSCRLARSLHSTH